MTLMAGISVIAGFFIYLLLVSADS